MLRLRRTSLAVLALALTASVLAACGSDSSSGSDDAATVMAQTFGGAKSIKSGQLGLTLAMKGTDGTDSSVSLTGPFQSNGVDKVPSFDLTFALSGQGQTFTLGGTSTGTKGYVTVAGTSYVLDAASYAGFAKGYTSSQKSSKAPKNAPTLAKLGIDPRRWLSSPKIVGTTESGGAQTIHIVAGVTVPSLLRDLNALLGKAKGSGLGGSAAGAVPDKLTAGQLASAQKSIKAVKVDVFTGKDDKTLRRMVVSFDLALPKGQTVGGFGSGRVTLDLTISDLNQPQTITAPKNAQPFSQLQDQLKGVVSGLQGQTPSASGSSGSGSSGSGGADTSGSSTTDAPSSKYLDCLQKAGSDLGEVQKCASLVGQ